jgi:hypothetical protein
MQPISPEISEQSTEDVGPFSAQSEVDRKPGREARLGDILEVDTIHDELSRSLIDERLKLCTYRLHHVLIFPGDGASGVASRVKLSNRRWISG